MAQRAAICRKFCDAFEAKKDAVAIDLTWQMGRPIRYSANEVRGTLERARYMIDIAPEALADVDAGPKADFRRFIRREPLGVVFTVAAWNYPYLIAVNSVVPAIMAGNAVVLKHSAQTPLCAERFAEAFREAGLPEGVFQVLHLSHEDTERVAKDPRVAFVAFTGSVAGGHAIQRAIADRFIGAGLGAGRHAIPRMFGTTPISPHAIENLVDGAFFNSGQSCCGIQRIYVHEKVYDDFVDGAIALTRQYVLGNPSEQATTLGPVVRTAGSGSGEEADRRERRGGREAGHRRACVRRRAAPARRTSPLSSCCKPASARAVMREEIFGPVAGIMKVRSDDEADATHERQRVRSHRRHLDARTPTPPSPSAIASTPGTWFMNRCDYLDPALAWVGVKDSGRGCTLSRVGYEHLTRPKSFHLRTRT